MSEERIKRMNRERRFKKIALIGTIAIVTVGAIVGVSIGISKAVQANETASQVVFVEEEFVMGECTKVSEGNYTVTFSGLVRNNTKESVTATITALTYYNNSWRELASADKELNYNTGVLLPGKRTTYLCVGSIPRQLIDYRMRVVWQKA